MKKEKRCLRAFAGGAFVGVIVVIVVLIVFTRVVL